LGLVQGVIHDLLECIALKHGLEIGVLVGHMDDIANLVRKSMSFGFWGDFT